MSSTQAEKHAKTPYLCYNCLQEPLAWRRLTDVRFTTWLFIRAVYPTRVVLHQHDMHCLACFVIFAGASGLAEADRRAKSSFSSYRSHQSSSSVAVQTGKMTVTEILAQHKQLAVLAEQIAATPQQQLGRIGI
jgi:hypothetical protein